MLRLFAAAVGFTLAMPSMAWAGGGQPLDVPSWSVVPFVLLLLAIAVLPLVASHFWEKNRNKAIIVAAFAVPVACYLISLGEPGVDGLMDELDAYFGFIALLWSLYTVSGGIVLAGDIQARPWVNTVFLAAGCILANGLGTTGASMLLIRPILRINQQRQRTRHLPIFFIFVVCNLGGLLTPLGDPPLFLGFLKGVAFFWTLSLWKEWLIVNGAVLAIFFVWDTLAYRHETVRARAADERHVDRLRLSGTYNFLFIVGIIVAVLGQSRILAGPFHLQQPLGAGVMIAMGLLSLLVTPRKLRATNRFGWHAIVEVAILFMGIFVTMVPALALLRLHGAAYAAKLGVSEPWQYFWLTGVLSSFLDNAPTYVAMGTLAGGSDDFQQLVVHNERVLRAISCGAVFMGAMTYVGNGPNFMVKAIADEMGYKMPSFFGYVLYSSAILMPLFIFITFLF